MATPTVTSTLMASGGGGAATPAPMPPCLPPPAPPVSTGGGGGGGPMTCDPTVTCVQIEPFTSSGGSQFLKVDVTTVPDQMFTTLKLALVTDG
eukprot:7382909-Prymnesium_polylepis.1